jgi:hypothetical protein
VAATQKQTTLQRMAPKRITLKKILLTAGLCAAGAVVMLGTAVPAFAKYSTLLSGPHTAQLRHPFSLTVSVGDDAGAKPARARLELRGARGDYLWYGAWQRLHVDGFQDFESYTFVVTGNHRGAETFRAVITGYATTNPVTVVVVQLAPFSPGSAAVARRRADAEPSALPEGSSRQRPDGFHRFWTRMTTIFAS